MWRAALLLALAATPLTAQARAPQALACAVLAAPEGLDAQLADTLLTLDEAKNKPALDVLHALVDRCAADQFLGEKERSAYFGYVLGRMARDGLDARLKAEGIPSGLIDKALDIGPGNANNPATQVTQGDLRRIANALAETGKDPAKVTPVGWGLITAWIAATAQMFDALRALD
ncbi:hypothetical protein AQZ52_16790 [Novosphingobium fuchskuhlense]|uniref:Uncharacterized protein n=1 Tax=Novosphingobium fuchskuhlense TaxID=1117702 RepID=A0A117UTA0_9SPHN|nr:hypothetical protein [Novosphingobium fuchskuhlense]KUR70471.1 hypothetical protein AQZ52_16790 [Novosphingobium fuchskuhlense]